MNMIRAVYFDAVGTLIHPEPAAALVYTEAAWRFGSQYSLESIKERFGRALQSEDEIDRTSGWITSPKREYQRWRTIVAVVLDDVVDPAACFDFLYAHFARAASWQCAPEAQAVLAELRVAGYELGLASNFDARLYTLIQEIEPLHCLADNVVVSSEVGYRKPAPAFFDAMCRQVGLPAAYVLYVGDDVENDGAGAAAAGLRAILFDPRGRHGKWPGARIGDLREVTQRLQNEE